MATAKNRAIDRCAAGDGSSASTSSSAHELEPRRATPPEIEPRATTTIGDDLLRLIFVACHPVLSTRGARRAHAAAARRADDGGDRARLSRLRGDHRAADRAREAHARRGAGRLRGAARDERASALASVLEVVYLVFNEGYAATAGDDWMRPELCERGAAARTHARRAAARASPRCTGSWR